MGGRDGCTALGRNTPKALAGSFGKEDDITGAPSPLRTDGGVADGDPLPNIPEKTMSVILGKYLPTDVGDFDLRLIFDWRDESYSQVGFIDESTLDDRELLNIVATYTNGPWTVTGYVNNALDEEFYNGLIYGPSSSQAFGLFGVNYTNVGLPRMAGIKVGYEF